MGEWRECRLGDIGTVVGGGTPSRERADYWDGPIPWLTPGELTGNRKKYVSKTQDGISTLGLAASGAKLLSVGSLLITSRASIGSCALAGKPMATNQGFTNLTPGSDVDPSFLFHLGLTLGREMTRRASGTTFLEISGREFGRIAIWLPPLEEQRRIAEILDTIDETIQATERVIAKRRQLRNGMISDLIEHASGGWPSARLSSVMSTFVDGDWIEAPFITNRGIRLIQTGNVGVGVYLDKLESQRFISPATFDLLHCSEVRAGDLLICRLADPVGRACIAPPDVGDAITAVDCTIARVNRSKADTSFLRYLMSTPRWAWSL